MKFTAFVGTLAHTVAIGGHAFNTYGGLIPPHQQAKVAMGIGLAQLIVGRLQQTRNSDGTPQETAFRPPTAPPSFQ